MATAYQAGSIEVFEDNLEPVKVIEQEDARLFAVDAVLMHLDDKHNEVYNYALVQLLDNLPVPVVGEDGAQIGWANLSIKGNKLLASIKIDFHCPERLSVEAGQAVWALPLVERYRGLDVKDKKDEPLLVSHIQVTSIRLSTGIRPGDRGLPPVWQSNN